MNTNKHDIISLVEILGRLGVTQAVLSPGSRNAPLIKAFNQHKNITCYSVVDERSAGFFALGIAQQLRKPVALVCTSGSALLNYGPAVVEAYYQRLPLLVISADRPAEWIGQADGQAIDQHKVFQNFTKGYFECRESHGNKGITWHNERNIAEACQLTTMAPMGPVHLNVPLSEPLYQLENNTAVIHKVPALNTETFSTPAPSAIQAFAASISRSPKVMLLAGLHHPDKAFENVIKQFSELPQAVVLTETTANLFGHGHIDTIDRVLATIPESSHSDFAPDILITFGGMVVTRRLKQILRNNPSTEHWHIDNAQNHTDTYQALTHHVQADHVKTLELTLPFIKANNSNYGALWHDKNHAAQALHNDFTKQVPYSDFAVFDTILGNLPNDSILQIGNSSPVRYVQLFNNKPGIAHYCNRGVSGIDGCTSTAAGTTAVSKKPVTLISGEISFLYDSNGLWNNYFPKNFTAIVINNSGGNIFRIIDGPDQFEEMPEYIETTHNISVAPLASLYGFRYISASNPEELKAALSLASDHTRKTIIEVFTPQKESPRILKSYWAFLKSPQNQ